MRIVLRPNVHSAFRRTGGRGTGYEMIELASDPEGAPFGLVHVDVFYVREDQLLYDRLLDGKTVMVELTAVPAEDPEQDPGCQWPPGFVPGAGEGGADG